MHRYKIQYPSSTDSNGVALSALVYQLLRLHAKMDSVSETQDSDVQDPLESDSTSPVIEISRSPPRTRPWSTEGVQAVLHPSPVLIEGKASKDDINLPPHNPVTPKRPNYPARGLSLQMPPRDTSSTSTANLIKRVVPLSPRLDPSPSYATSPGSALPRRSRGLDFSRSRTSLHHSILAEQSSPDSSPVVGGRGGITIPSRKSIYNSTNTPLVPDSPGTLSGSLWSTGASTERGGVSSSLGSVGMIEYGSGSSSEEEDELMGHDDEEDTIHMTPQIWRSGNGSTNLFGAPTLSSPAADPSNPFSPAAAKSMSFPRPRTRQRRVRKSSSSASGYSAYPPSGPVSPAPLLKSIESSMTADTHKDPSKREIDSRRQSLSLGTCDLELSDGDQSEGGKSTISPQEDSAIPTPATPGDERRDVIRRAVNRRGNLLVPLSILGKQSVVKLTGSSRNRNRSRGFVHFFKKRVHLWIPKSSEKQRSSVKLGKATPMVTFAECCHYLQQALLLPASSQPCQGPRRA